MTSITAEDIKRIAELAGLAIDDASTQSFTKSVAAILSYMDDIKLVEVKDLPPTLRLTEETNVWREDVIEPSLSPSDLFRNGKVKGGHFVVPAVIKRN